MHNSFGDKIDNFQRTKDAYDKCHPYDLTHLRLKYSAVINSVRMI